MHTYLQYALRNAYDPYGTHLKNAQVLRVRTRDCTHLGYAHKCIVMARAQEGTRNSVTHIGMHTYLGYVYGNAPVLVVRTQEYIRCAHRNAHAQGKTQEHTVRTHTVCTQKYTCIYAHKYAHTNHARECSRSTSCTHTGMHTCVRYALRNAHVLTEHIQERTRTYDTHRQGNNFQ